MTHFAAPLRTVALTLCLSVSLVGCSTMEGVQADFDSLFRTTSPAKATEKYMIQTMTVEQALGEYAAHGPSPISYDRAASVVSDGSVELYSFDSPGVPVRAASAGVTTPGQGTMAGVPSSTDPSVTVFPFSEDMYTPGVRPNNFYGVRPPVNAEPLRLGDGSTAELLPMYVGQPNRIYFDHGSAALTGAARQVIASVASQYGSMQAPITVEAHASQRAAVRDVARRTEVNYRMSMKRAMAVTKQLIAQGVPANMIKTTALGDTRPIAMEVDAESEALNRRVEILTRP
jgi:outer membrane protein OmpA-like peptidoglycan-associated protein